ncbi:MAG: [FeFe] hydrogenase H-cluster maturation GTPase HydF [Clostridia bacterium]|nr:[FeFe] hydrogenase H-cluster maturation GTPase HydF [Clostridia bacterium]
MSLNDVVSAERLHIGFFGLRNAGKSSVVNAVTGQELSLVSAVKGTTTDPVKKAMELLPLGPVVIVDTPGIDDEGELGEMRVKKTKQVLNYIDIAVLVVDSTLGLQDFDREMLSLFAQKKIPFVVAYNKSDLFAENVVLDDNTILVSAKNGTNINELKEKIAHAVKVQNEKKQVVGDLLNKGDVVVLVTPIDSAAPKGRLILPQQMTIRDILDVGAIPIVTRETELETTLNLLKEKPRMVITDSQAFGFVSKIVGGIPLTSFSILMARYKGSLQSAVKGAEKMKNLNDGDTILISEGCTHHRQCGDIGTQKLPKWLKEYSGKELNFKFTSGKDFPEDLSGISLVIHCGGCMLTEREMQYRRRFCEENNVPITNYGTAIAEINGILEKSLQPIK